MMTANETATIKTDSSGCLLAISYIAASTRSATSHDDSPLGAVVSNGFRARSASYHRQCASGFIQPGRVRSLPLPSSAEIPIGLIVTDKPEFCHCFYSSQIFNSAE